MIFVRCSLKNSSIVFIWRLSALDPFLSREARLQNCTETYDLKNYSVRFALSMSYSDNSLN